MDGRYSEAVQPLRYIFSEFGLIRLRVFVEIEWLLALTRNTSLQELGPLPFQINNKLRTIVSNFTEDDAMAVKEIEKQTNHDVKAVEYYIKERIDEIPGLERVREFVHFGCTSYDINDNCFGLMLVQARNEVLVPLLKELVEHLQSNATEYASVPMLSRTHGQPASTTTVGKEINVFVHRLERQIQLFEEIKINGKFGGAVGNYNALVSAYPDVDWPAFNSLFVEKVLGLHYNPMTTQTEPHDYIGEYCHTIQRINSILLDLCRDFWGYISLGYFKQVAQKAEVGSSTMPHKVNPIDFENAEGNLGMANANLGHLAEKLPVSRWQRDLSDSTVLRNLGIGVGYSLIAYHSILKGLRKLDVNRERLNEDLDNAWEILSEPIQTVMRKHGADIPYEQLKQLTRGVKVTQQTLHEFIEQLGLPQKEKERLLALTPHSYLGQAIELAKLAPN